MGKSLCSGAADPPWKPPVIALVACCCVPNVFLWGLKFSNGKNILSGMQKSVHAVIRPDRYKVGEQTHVEGVEKLVWCVPLRDCCLLKHIQVILQDKDDDSGSNVTFAIANEDHTLGNSLRYMLMKEFVSFKLCFITILVACLLALLIMIRLLKTIIIIINAFYLW